MRPAASSSRESMGVLEILNSILPIQLTEHIVRKAAHFLEFFVLGILLCQVFLQYLKYNIKYCVYPLVLVFMTAFLDETIQLFVENRSGQISDVWLDFSGGFLAIISTYVIIKLVNKFKGGD